MSSTHSCATSGSSTNPWPSSRTCGPCGLSIVTVIVWNTVPLVALSLLASLQSIPDELNEAAALDGASRWQQFRYITLPFLMPTIVVLTLMSVFWTFNNFVYVWLATGAGPGDVHQRACDGDLHQGVRRLSHRVQLGGRASSWRWSWLCSASSTTASSRHASSRTACDCPFAERRRALRRARARVDGESRARLMTLAVLVTTIVVLFVMVYPVALRLLRLVQARRRHAGRNVGLHAGQLPSHLRLGLPYRSLATAW